VPHSESFAVRNIHILTAKPARQLVAWQTALRRAPFIAHTEKIHCCVFSGAPSKKRHDVGQTVRGGGDFTVWMPADARERFQKEKEPPHHCRVHPATAITDTTTMSRPCHHHHHRSCHHARTTTTTTRGGGELPAAVMYIHRRI
jgi:hypothetical protein